MKAFDEVIETIRETHKKCPWDREQTIESLIKYLEEETDEVREAVINKDDENLKEELGDLLWDIFFMIEIADKEDKFSLKDVLSELKDKIIRRHPHVFGDEKAETAEEAIKHFYEAKKNEKNDKKD